MKNKINWIPKQAGDKELVDASDFIQSLQGESVRRSKDLNYFLWKILDNPFGEGEMWIVKDKYQVIGTVSLTPKHLYINGMLKNGAELGDGFTHPDYQKKGIFSSLLNIINYGSRVDGIEFIYGTPNEQALPVEIKVGYRVIPSAHIYNLVRPINIESVIKSRFPFLPRIFIPLLSMILRFMIILHSPKSLSEKVDIFLVSEFPKDIETLSQRASIKYNWILERSKQYLDWRYIENPDSYEIFVAKVDNKTLGYVVTKPGLWRELKVLYIADYLMLPGRESAFDEVLSSIIKRARIQEMDMISCWSVETSEYTQLLKNRGFLRFRDVPVICYANELGKQVLHTDYKWHFTMADSDNI